MEKYEKVVTPGTGEKPEFLYHGSVTPDIEELEPRKRYTPGGFDTPPRIYATGNPAFAAAHSFPWSGQEGIDLGIEEGKVILKIPERFKKRLDQEVFMYTLKSDTFSHTIEESTGETFHTEEKVKPEKCQRFGSVTEAIEYFGGRVEVL